MNVKNHSSVAGALLLLVVLLAVFGPRLVHTVRDRLASFSLKVPFTTQAPTGKWENNENCEEASAIMANAYLTDYTADELTVSSTQEAINKLVAWEMEHFGHAENTGVDEIAQMIEGVFDLETSQIKDFTEDDLKNELLQHHVLILPINAELLGIPAYPENSQVYHVIVVRGYTPKGFLVNDPGLSAGKNNLYSFETLRDATSDWDQEHGTVIPSKVVLSVRK